jgi:hypothetical protein
MTIRWAPVVTRAARIVNGYDTPVTLRQVFYRLVAANVLPNTKYYYNKLSERTADARRQDEFPDLSDRGRDIHYEPFHESPEEALEAAAQAYRRDRTEGQEISIYVGVEKAVFINQFEDWFGDQGIPILALGGYSSQTYVDQVKAHVAAQKRPALLFYAGDHDPSGWDIQRDFVKRTDCWEDDIRIALTPELIEAEGIEDLTAFENDPLTQEKLLNDARARGFVERFGNLIQIELDALDPVRLRDLFREQIDPLWDWTAYRAMLQAEATDREVMQTMPYMVPRITELIAEQQNRTDDDGDDDDS